MHREVRLDRAVRPSPASPSVTHHPHTHTHTLHHHCTRRVLRTTATLLLTTKRTQRNGKAAHARSILTVLRAPQSINTTLSNPNKNTSQVGSTHSSTNPSFSIAFWPTNAASIAFATARHGAWQLGPPTRSVASAKSSSQAPPELRRALRFARPSHPRGIAHESTTTLPSTTMHAWAPFSTAASSPMRDFHSMAAFQLTRLVVPKLTALPASQHA